MDLKVHPRRILLLALIALFVMAILVIRIGTQLWNVVASDRSTVPNTRPENLPNVILWAWERPEDLSFIDSRKTSVAFLAKTIFLRGDKVLSRPRLQPLKLAEGTALIVVARIESDRTEHPTLSPNQLQHAVSELAQLATLPNISAIQIDFDATVSQREFYQQLLFNLRSEVSGSIALSITALASWCLGDDWLADLPVDEAVPMLFRMGVDQNQILAHLLSGKRFSSKPCQTSIGISTDEPLPPFSAGSRVYVFNPAPWSRASVQKIMEDYD